MVNDLQVGGTHYRSAYQHWDFVTDIGLCYLLANATKYIARHAKKNGEEDIQKAIHYCQKAKERWGSFNTTNVHHLVVGGCLDRFIIQSGLRDTLEEQILNDICFLERPMQLDSVIAKLKSLYGQKNPFGYNEELDAPTNTI